MRAHHASNVTSDEKRNDKKEKEKEKTARIHPDPKINQT